MADVNRFHKRLEVELHRGLRTCASRAIAGQANYKASSKTYAVTVEPHARIKKAKEILRAASRPTSQIDWYDEKSKEQGPEGSNDLAMEAAMEDRSCFRRDRVKRFEVGRHFPVLVSPRLVPSWQQQQQQPSPQSPRLARSGTMSSGQRLPSSEKSNLEQRTTVPGGDGWSSRQQKNAVKIRDKERLELPTISMTVKKQSKKEPNLSGWKHCGTAEAQGLISNRKPANHTDPYFEPMSIDFRSRSPSPRAAGSNEASDQRDRSMVSARATPVPLRHVQASSDSDKEDLQFQIAQRLERGILHCEALKERYEHHRDLFQQEKERKGRESPFEVAMRIKNERNREAVKRLASVHQAQNHNAPLDGTFSSRFSLGFSKFRKNE